MLRLSGVALAVALVCAFALTGCGGGGGDDGGGGGGGTNPPPVDPTKTIVGKVVSSLNTSRGVANVVVKFGAAYAITNSTGDYTITYVPTQTELPYYLEVDTSGAGSSYPTTELVAFADGQTFYPNQVSVPQTILNGISASMPTIIVKEVSPDSPPGVPYPTNNTMVYGRLVKASDGSGVANATIKLGANSASPLTVTTGSRGYFVFALGTGKMLFDVVGTDLTFSVDLSTASGFDSTTTLSYGASADAYFQNQAIDIAYPTLNLIGIIEVNDSGGGGGGPPPPPI